MRYLLTLALTTGLFVATLGVFAPAHAQGDLTSDPGYVDMTSVDGWFNSEATVRVDIQGELLNLIASASDDSRSDFSQVVQNLRAIQVRAYSMQGMDATSISERVDELASRLERDGWSRALFIRNEDSVSRVYVRRNASEDEIHGLTVFTTKTDGESVFVNIVGPMTPEQIHRLGDDLDIESLRQTGSRVDSQ